MPRSAEAFTIRKSWLPTHALVEPVQSKVFSLEGTLDCQVMNPASWADAAESAYPRVFRALVAMGASPADAADVLQDAFARRCQSGTGRLQSAAANDERVAA
jgi:hypothetical protein